MPFPDSNSLLDRTVIALLEDAGIAVLTLTEGLEPEEFLRSRLIRPEVRRQLQVIARLLDDFDDASRATLPEIDWAGWQMLARRFDAGPDAEGAAQWFAITSLVPATLMWLRFYREPQQARRE